MNWFELFYTVLGGLGIFLYGMLNLSKGLQAIGGKLIRKAINSLTTNRLIAVVVGTVVTVVLQSSTITTVMVVGFVNAGLMSLQQSIGVIFGANIGTTITGWIIAVKIGKYSWLLIGVGVILMLLAKHHKVQTWARVSFALGLVFLGLETMGAAFKPLRSDEGFLSLLSYFTADNRVSLYGTIAVGCLLTMVVQSSSAMLGITMALATTGTITFQTAVALVMGENVGTTITALLAGVAGNQNARRAALAHAVFNILGVFVLSTFFWQYVGFIEAWLPYSSDFVNEAGDKPHIAEHIALSHTFFNVANVLIFLPFLGHLARFVTRMIPETRAKQPKHLEFLGPKYLLSPELALQQGRMELAKVAEMDNKMLQWTKDYLVDPLQNADRFERVMKYESITDKIHQEMTIFMGQVLEGTLSPDEVEEAKFQLRVIDELESVADYCQKTMRYVQLLANQNQILDRITVTELSSLLDAVMEYYGGVLEPLKGNVRIDKDRLSAIRLRFEQESLRVRDEFLGRVAAKEVSAVASMTVADIALCCRRMLSHSRAIATALLAEQQAERR